MALNRREVINKWIRLKNTEINPKTGVEETHNQLEWLKLANKNQSTRFN